MKIEELHLEEGYTIHVTTCCKIRILPNFYLKKAATFKNAEKAQA
jgi:hypothetical protein